ncbi:PREDICTED: transmembrane protein 99, partial [Ceratotherium simum simum]|uniref:Transmembrane protein 99 n=1 Tax=Ceratotherium simum simum TaxID=73337 RepID=A0ABM1D2R3_CERSS
EICNQSCNCELWKQHTVTFLPEAVVPKVLIPVSGGFVAAQPSYSCWYLSCQQKPVLAHSVLYFEVLEWNKNINTLYQLSRTLFNIGRFKRGLMLSVALFCQDVMLLPRLVQQGRQVHFQAILISTLTST